MLLIGSTLGSPRVSCEGNPTQGMRVPDLEGPEALPAQGGGLLRHASTRICSVNERKHMALSEMQREMPVQGKGPEMKLPTGSPFMENSRFHRPKEQSPRVLSVGPVCLLPLPPLKVPSPFRDIGGSAAGETELGWRQSPDSALTIFSFQKKDEAKVSGLVLQPEGVHSLGRAREATVQFGTHDTQGKVCTRQSSGGSEGRELPPLIQR